MRYTIPVDISVVIPALNAADTIGAQLDAVLAQDFAGTFEVVVADNGSTDGTLEVVETYRVRVVDASDAPLGGAGAKNVGVRAASAPFVAFCDADDLVSPGWLQAVYDGLQRSPVVSVTCEYWTLNPAMRGLGAEVKAERTSDGVPVFAGGAFGMSRQLYLDAGGFDETFTGPVDTEFALRVHRKFGVAPLHVDAVIHVRQPVTIRASFRRGRFLGRSAHVLHPGRAWHPVKRAGWLAVHAPQLFTRHRVEWAHNAGSLVGEIQGRSRR